MSDTPLVHIGQRYTQLAESTCCLSCGGALDFAGLKPGEVGVDLGSGRGNDVLRMAEAVGPQGFAYGIDVSDGMLEKAGKTAAKLGVANAAFLKSEFEHLALPAATADVVISNCAINHAADKPKVWSEIFRVLKPGGRFVVSDIYALAPVPAEYAADPAAVAECWAGAIEKDLYLHILFQTGFEGVRVLEESAPYEKGRIVVSSFTLTGARPLAG
jgi:SAM-dependent methyltransferase